MHQSVHNVNIISLNITQLIDLQIGHYCPPGYCNNESMDAYNKDVSWYSRSCIDQVMAKLVRSYNAFTNLYT